MLNKKAQISEGVTWVVATIAILIILFVSIFVSSFFISSNKTISQKPLAYISQEKSFLAYLNTRSASGESVFDSLQDKKELDSFTGNLALQIFGSKGWIGISAKTEDIDLTKIGIGADLSGKENQFYGSKPSLKIIPIFTLASPASIIVLDSFYYSRYSLSDEEFVEVILP